MRPRIGRFQRLVVKLLVGIAAVLLLTAGSCGGDDTADSIDEVLAEVQTQLDAQQESLQQDQSNEQEPQAVEGADVQSGEFETVFGLPPFGSASLQPGFGQYELIDDELRRSENVYFLMTGAELDQIISYYADTLRSAGYEVGAPLALGESVALNVTVPGEPNVSGVVQVGPVSPNDPTLAVNQQLSEFKVTPQSDGDGGGGSVETEADALVEESG